MLVLKANIFAHILLYFFCKSRETKNKTDFFGAVRQGLMISRDKTAFPKICLAKLVEVGHAYRYWAGSGHQYRYWLDDGDGWERINAIYFGKCHLTYYI